MKVKQWCAVTRGAKGFGHMDHLLLREVEMGAIPDVGETSAIELYRSSDDGDAVGGPMTEVKRRYWDCDGTVHLELISLDIDPEGPLFEHYQRKTRHDAPRYSKPWYTERDGDPVPAMLASGWIEYNP